MSQALGFAVLAGLISGGLSLALMTGSMSAVLLAYFVQLPVLFIGLTFGLTASAIAVVCAAVLSAAIAGMLGSLIYVVVQGLPALFVVRQMLLFRVENGQTAWYPPGLMLAQLVALAAGTIVLAFIVFMGQPGGLQGVIENFLIDALTQIGAASGQPIIGQPAFESWTFAFPAVLATSWLLMVVINSTVAQALAVRLGWNRRPSPELATLELPFWLWPALGLAAFLALLGDSALGFLGRSLLIVLVVPFAFLGLAVIHKWARRWSHRHLALAAIYAGIVVFGWPILAVLALGLVEDWAHLRRYM